MDGASLQAALQQLLDEQSRREHDYMREIVALREQVELLSHDLDVERHTNAEALALAQAQAATRQQDILQPEQTSLAATQGPDKAQVYRIKYYKYKLLYLGQAGLCRKCGTSLAPEQHHGPSPTAQTPRQPRPCASASPPASISPHSLMLPGTPDSQLQQSPAGHQLPASPPQQACHAVQLVLNAANNLQSPLPGQAMGYPHVQQPAVAAGSEAGPPSLPCMILHSPTRVRGPNTGPALLQPMAVQDVDAACFWCVPETLLPAFDGTVGLVGVPCPPEQGRKLQRTAHLHAAGMGDMAEQAPVSSSGGTGGLLRQRAQDQWHPALGGHQPSEPTDHHHDGLAPLQEDNHAHHAPCQQPVPAARGDHRRLTDSVTAAHSLRHVGAAQGNAPGHPRALSSQQHVNAPGGHPGPSTDIPSLQTERPSPAHTATGDAGRACQGLSPGQAGAATTPKRPLSTEPPPVIVIDFSPTAGPAATAAAALHQTAAKAVQPAPAANSGTGIGAAQSTAAPVQQPAVPGIVHSAPNVGVLQHSDCVPRPDTQHGTGSTPSKPGTTQSPRPSGQQTKKQRCSPPTISLPTAHHQRPCKTSEAPKHPQPSPTSQGRAVGSSVMQHSDLQNFKTRKVRALEALASHTHAPAAAVPHWQSTIPQCKGFKKKAASTSGSSDSGGQSVPDEQQVSKRARVHMWQAEGSQQRPKGKSQHAEQPMAAASLQQAAARPEAAARRLDMKPDFDAAGATAAAATAAGSKPVQSPGNGAPKSRARVVLADRTTHQAHAALQPSPMAKAQRSQPAAAAVGSGVTPPPGFKSRRRAAAGLAGADDLAAVPQPMARVERSTCAVLPAAIQPTTAHADGARAAGSSVAAAAAPVTIPCVVKRQEAKAAPDKPAPAQDARDCDMDGVRPVKYTEVVRGKGRADLQGYACQQCHDFYNAMVSWQRPGATTDPQPGLRPECGHTPPSHSAATNAEQAGAGEASGAAGARVHLIQHGSRHRAQWAPPPGTPDGFWSLTFPEQPSNIASPF